MLEYYYPRSCRAIVVALADIFNDIVCYNFDTISGDTSAAIQTINVPIQFGPQDKKYLSRKEEESGQRYQIQLPEIKIELKSIQYDEKRATGTNEYRYFINPNIPFHDLDTYYEDTQPAPYNFNFDLKIRTNSLDHSWQITEQILPYFNPTITLSIKEFKFLNLKRDLKVRISDTSFEFQEDLTENDRREIISSIPIVVEAFLYKPISTAKIIKEVIYNQYINQVDVSGSISDYNFLTTTYRTSGVEGYNTSAFIPGSHYDTSAYDSISNTYYFTSALGYT